MKKGILFDLDGTLWDSSKEVADSWLLAVSKEPDMKERITREAIQAVMGKTMDEIADILFTGVSKERRIQLLWNCVQVENQYINEHGGQLMEGLLETLTILKRRYHLYIVSNCQEGYIEAFLNYHKLWDYFDDFECYGATKRQKGENIRLVIKRNHLDQAVYVGDTQGDYDAASFAEVPFIHARTGYGEIAEKVPFVEKLGQLPERIAEIL